jgi:hypothetical protein
LGSQILFWKFKTRLKMSLYAKKLQRLNRIDERMRNIEELVSRMKADSSRDERRGSRNFYLREITGLQQEWQMLNQTKQKMMRLLTHA